MHHGGQFRIQKIQRNQNPQLPHFLRSLEQKQGVGRKNMPPAHTTTYWVSNHLSHPSSLTPGHTLTLTLYKGQAWEVSGQENLLFALDPPLGQWLP